MTLLPFPVTNHVFSPVAPDPRDVAGILDEVRRHDVPFTVQVWGDAPNALDDALRNAGLEPIVHFPLMALEPLRRTTEKLPHDIVIERVVADDHVRAHREVSALVFGAPLGVSEALSPPAALQSDRCAYFVAVEGGRVVGTSVAFVSGDVVGIFGVTVLVPARGRGVGAAVTQRAVEYGRRAGATLAYLQSSEAGFSVYARMGFEVVGSHRLLRDKPPAGS